MGLNPDSGDQVRYVRLSGLITAGEGLWLQIDELDVLIASVHRVLDDNGFYSMLTWQLVTPHGPLVISINGPRSLEDAQE